MILGSLGDLKNQLREAEILNNELEEKPRNRDINTRASISEAKSESESVFGLMKNSKKMAHLRNEVYDSAIESLFRLSRAKDLSPIKKRAEFE